METLVNILNEIKSISYTKADIVSLISDSKVNYVIGSQIENTNEWTGTVNNISTLSALKSGQLFLYFLPKNSLPDEDVTLQLTFQDGTSTEKKPVRFPNSVNIKDSFKKTDILLIINFTNHMVALNNGGSLTIDNELNENSSNPLTNNAIFSSLENLKQELMEYINMDKYELTFTNPISNDSLGYCNKGLVQYTVNVKTIDINGDKHISPNTLIKFEKENGELLGVAVSNEAGNASIFKRHDNDVFRVVANVGNTSSALRQQIYVQEPNNLLPLNVWSGTDFMHSVNGFTRRSGVTASSSSEWSSIGNYSLKITKTSTKNTQVYTDTGEFTGYAGMKIAFDILTKNTDVTFRAADFTNEDLEQEIAATLYDEIFIETTIPPNEEKQTIIVSTLVPPDITQLRLIWVAQTQGEPVYIDNIRVVGVSGETMFWDDGVIKNAEWVKSNSEIGAIIRSSDGLTMSNNSDTLLQIFANKYGTPVIIGNNSTLHDYNAPYVIEFDVLDTQSTTYNNAETYPVLRIYGTDIDVDVGTVDTQISETGHYKLSYDGTTLQTYVNDTRKQNKTFTTTNARIGFCFRNNNSLRIKNFRIYKISY